MIQAVRGWLLALISASLVCALAGALMPKGPVRRVGQLVCGLVLTAAMLSPLRELDISGGQRWLEDYLSSLSRRELELSQELDGQMKVIIEGEYAAYIVDKAAQLGLTCGARVECQASEEGLYLPLWAEITGLQTEEERARLRRIIAEDLGIPAQAQFYVEEEEVL